MANKNNKYKVYRKYTTDDNGITWVETDEYRIVLVEENSKDCITETPTNTRWVETTGYICANKNKYTKEIKQISTDGGKTWTDTSEYRQGKLIEENSKDCGYTEVQYRWVVINDDSRYVCVGTEKHKMEIRQLSNDGGITWANVSPEETRASDEIIERNSLDCGGTAIYYKWVDTGFECGSNIPTGSKIVDEAPGELTKETVYRWVVAQGANDYICDDGNVKYYIYVKQQSTDGGITWSEVQPREMQKGSVMENKSYDCIPECKTKVTYNDGTTKKYSINGTIANGSIDNVREATKVDIGTCATNIGDNAFEYCKNLSYVTIPNSVTSIGRYAFFNCESLTYLKIPDSVNWIKEAAFDFCESLTSVTIPDSVEYINSYAFNGCSGLTYIKLSNSLTSIDEAAFANCLNLTSIEIPDSIISIDNEAFSGCTNLSAIMIPYSVKYICDSAFGGCSSITSITIPNSVTSIGRRVFQNCSNLASITIPDSVISIGDGAFSGCTNLASASIGSGATSIGDRAFENCDSLTSITIPNSVKSIGRYAFYNCKSLTSVMMPECAGIDNYAFYNCESLTSITIPKCISIINEGSFFNCKSLKTVTMPNVICIWDSAFAGCTSLTSIFYDGTMEEWKYVQKESSWNSGVPTGIVHCTDGDASINASVKR